MNSPRPMLADRRPVGTRATDGAAAATTPATPPARRTAPGTGAPRRRPRQARSGRNRSCRGVSVPGWWPRRTRKTCRFVRCCCCCSAFCRRPPPRPRSRCSSPTPSGTVRVPPGRPATGNRRRPFCLAFPTIFRDGLAPYRKTDLPRSWLTRHCTVFTRF